MMEGNGPNLRLRKNIKLVKGVENLDFFLKVQENTKEEQKTVSGIISLLCFIIISLLVTAEIWDYFFTKNTFNYNFKVDTDMEIEPSLSIDMMIASPCSMIRLKSSLYATEQQEDSLRKDTSRFEFTDEENLYWTVLRHAHASIMDKGKRGLEDLVYIDGDVEDQLERQADLNQKEGTANVERLKKEKGKSHSSNSDTMVVLLGNGFGVFQIVSQVSEDEGTACRIHGNLKVQKGREESLSLTLLPGFDHARNSNISHRIEKFHFGQHIPGLVTPLAGVEQISPSGDGTYRYYLKIVPTKLHTGIFSSPKLFYQYSLTFITRNSSQWNQPTGILFEFDFASTVIEINKAKKSLFALFISLCSIVGGIYACSDIFNGLINKATRVTSMFSNVVDDHTLVFPEQQKQIDCKSDLSTLVL